MILKKEIKKLMALGHDPKEVYKQLENSAKTEKEKDDLANMVAKTAMKNKQANMFNLIYLAIIFISTFFEIYTVFASDVLKQALHQAFMQQAQNANNLTPISNTTFDSFLSVMRLYFSIIIALITGALTYFLIRKNLIVYRVLYVTNVIYGFIFTLAALVALFKVGFTLSEVINCVLCYLLIYINFKIIKLYFPYLNIVSGLKKDNNGKYLITN